jgi:predicted nucleic acid-binding protein
LRLAEDKDITLVLPEFVLKEARAVLSHRFPGHEILLDAFIHRTQHAIVPMNQFEGEISRHRESVSDAKDIAVLAATIVAKPDLAVTGDKTLREDMKRSREVTNHTVVCSSSELLEEVLKRS